MFYIQLFYFKNEWIAHPLFFGDVSESLRSLTTNERCELIAQVAHQKWATMSNSLRLLRGNERMSEKMEKTVFDLKNSKNIFFFKFLFVFSF